VLRGRKGTRSRTAFLVSVLGGMDGALVEDLVRHVSRTKGGDGATQGTGSCLRKKDEEEPGDIISTAKMAKGREDQYSLFGKAVKKMMPRLGQRA